MALRMIFFPGLAGLVIGGMVAVFLVAKLHVRLGLALLAVGGVAGVGAAMGLAAWRIIGRVGGGLVGMIAASAAERGDPTFSLEGSLIARGRHAEAAELFRAHLDRVPTDNAARLALAGILAKPPHHSAEAERLYLEVRDGSANPNHAFEAANALIDLYRSTGQRGRLLAALARFAHQYHGTKAGSAAKRELSELKQTEP